MNIRRPALRYHGGKWRIAPWIISHFPPHTCYAEPYGGGCSVLLQKKPSYLEVYNDADGEVVSFFQVLRSRTAELIPAIELTPFARAELDLSYEPCEDELERARRFYIRSWQGRGGARTQWRTGWRFMKSHSRAQRSIDDWKNVDRLAFVVERLREVQIECDDALAIIQRYDAPGTLFYCDPPYLHETRGKWAGKAYMYEMTDEDHVKLHQVLDGIQGMAIVSGYSSELYEELYSGWGMVTREDRTDANTMATECLWISPNAARAKMPLFELCEREV